MAVARALIVAVIDCLNGNVLAPLTLVALFSRQSGKNETSARVEAYLMARFMAHPTMMNIVKTAPTFRPQLVVSKQRLRQTLDANLFLRNSYRPVEGYKFAIGNAYTTFLSTEKQANRVGETASLLLETDETQDTDIEIYQKDLRPMTLSTGAATMMWGTAWDLDNLLEQHREIARVRERELGRRLLFEVTWEEVAQYNDRYAAAVAEERRLLGDDHPIFQTQYCLKALAALGRLFEDRDIARMMGGYARRLTPRDGKFYVAGVDLCGADEMDVMEVIAGKASTKRDATFIVVAEVIYITDASLKKHPSLRVVDCKMMYGAHPLTMANEVFEYVYGTWNCMHVVVDARGVGEGVAKIVESRRPDTTTALKSTAEDVSRLGFNLLATAKSGRLKLYQNDGAKDTQELLKQTRLCQRELLPSGKIKFYAPITQQLVVETGLKEYIHDDAVKALSYCVEAGEKWLYSGIEASYFEAMKDADFDALSGEPEYSSI